MGSPKNVKKLKKSVILAKSLSKKQQKQQEKQEKAEMKRQDKRSVILFCPNFDKGLCESGYQDKRHGRGKRIYSQRRKSQPGTKKSSHIGYCCSVCDLKNAEIHKEPKKSKVF